MILKWVTLNNEYFYFCYFKYILMPLSWIFKCWTFTRNRVFLLRGITTFILVYIWVQMLSCWPDGGATVHPEGQIEHELLVVQTLLTPAASAGFSALRSAEGRNLKWGLHGDHFGLISEDYRDYTGKQLPVTSQEKLFGTKLCDFHSEALQKLQMAEAVSIIQWERRTEGGLSTGNQTETSK